MFSHRPGDEYFQRVLARRPALKRQPSRLLPLQIFIHSFPHRHPLSGFSPAGGSARSPAPDPRSRRACRFPSSIVSGARAVSVSAGCQPVLAAGASRKNGAYVAEDIGGTMSPAGLSRVKLFSPRIIALSWLQPRNSSCVVFWV